MKYKIIVDGRSTVIEANNAGEAALKCKEIVNNSPKVNIKIIPL